MLNVLTEPVFRTMNHRTPGTASLADILAAHAAEETITFPALRSHQQHAWHTFLCHTAVLAMEAAGEDTMPTTPDRWVSIIQYMTPAEHWPHCWEMFVPDLTKPAFLQPPIGPLGKPTDYARKYNTPDSADIVPATANHELKIDIALANQLDDWIMALISLQTQAGYDARKTYGIARMNSGAGNRACVTLRPSGRPESCVARDVHAIVNAQHQEPRRWAAEHDKIRLLWTIPWDGQENEYAEEADLHPLFIDAARRIRMRVDDHGTVQAVQALSEKRHVRDTEQQGFMADPWCPMNLKDKKSHTPALVGTTWRQVVEFVTNVEDWEPPILMCPTPNELEDQTPLQILTRNLTRGVGKTFGYHEQVHEVGPNTIRLLLRRPPDPAAVDAAIQRVKAVNSISGILRECLQILQRHGSATPKQYRTKGTRAQANQWTNFLNQQAGEIFFQHLEQELAAPEEERAAIRKAWVADELTPLASHILEQAQSTLRGPSQTAQQSRIRASNLLARRAERLSARAVR